MVRRRHPMCLRTHCRWTVQRLEVQLLAVVELELQLELARREYCDPVCLCTMHPRS